jgi:predicted RNase H-like HicB family nuclease
MTTEYVVVLEQAEASWGAYCPDVPGVGVVADTREEAEQLIREALELHVTELRAHGEPVPPATAVGATRVRVSA